MKKDIEIALQNGQFQEAKKHIEKYENIHPEDFDLLSYKCIYNMYIGEYDEAYRLAKIGIRRYPTSGEMYYNLASVQEEMKEYIEAFKNYYISAFLINYCSESLDTDFYYDVLQCIERLDKIVATIAEKAIDNKDYSTMQKISSLISRKEVTYGKNEKSTRNWTKSMIGQKYWITDNEQRYIGLYRYPIASCFSESVGDLVRWKGEFLRFKEGKSYSVHGDEGEYLIPIASDVPNIYSFQEDSQQYILKQYGIKQFEYYRVKGGTSIISKDTAYFGEPIPLKHNEKRKKLVLNIFLDGLAQEVISGNEFKSIMPNTAEFFNKGTVCTNAYSASEWTFPSLATYASGLDTLGHMMFHNTVDGELPYDITTLAEYFKEGGYYTSKIDGDWRCIYSYGFARGTDQYVYQIQHMGSRAEQEVSTIMEHIEAFKETDQYIWMTIGDLHDVADQMVLPISVQKGLSLKERSIVTSGSTSVKQTYDENKIIAYKKMCTYIDFALNNLYNYLEQNYSDEEMIVSVFADHGQGYLIPNGEHFLSGHRTNVAFMFRGGHRGKGEVSEIISTTDYLPIMCQLAGICLKNEGIQGRLPEVFGGEKREYVLSESLHPGDFYYAVIRTDKYEIYFDNPERAQQDGRFRLGNYKIYGFDYDGNKIQDNNILSKYEKIILKRIEPYIIYEDNE
ncbi:sulfatase-like hydrolase/transferase [Lachnospiraceae bacterium HCP1S3_C3]